MSLELAIEWAALGHRVLPVSWTGRKRPMIKQWQIDCTTDIETIRRWWTRWPEARVGLATGQPGYDVLDFDVADGKPGMAQLEKLIDAGILAPSMFMVVATPTGGRHLYGRGSEQHNKQNEKTIPGVDFRGVGGMVLAPGNVGYRYVSGRSLDYEELGVIDWAAVARCLAPPEPEPKMAPVFAPPTPIQHPTPGKLKAPPSNFDNAPGEESPLDWFVRNHRFADILAADGWSYAYTDAQERAYWVRPGKKEIDGVSANVMVNADGRETLMSFSSTVTWLPTDRGMSVAQYVAHRDHGGDLRTMAKHVRTTMMPRRETVNAMGSVAPPVTQGGQPGTQAPPAPASVSVGTPGRELDVRMESGHSTGAPGTSLVPAAEVGTPEPVQAFWQSRRELREVWYKAVRGGVSPWAVLGNVLANVAGRVGPHVRLPPRGGVGKAASLNMLIGVMGNSGTGKGLSAPIAREFMGPPWPEQRKPGTGQGIAAMFTTMTREGPVQEVDSVVLNVNEITSLGAHMSQQGATITSTLLEIYMAEELGEHYANKELRRPVKDGHYRLALVAGIQPGNSAIVFDHAESGLPQRFLWMPAFWPDAVLPTGPLIPPAPGSELARWRIDGRLVPGSLDEELLATETWSPTDAIDKKPGKKEKEPEAVPVPVKEQMLVEYAPSVKREIDRDHNQRLNALKKRLLAGEDDPGDPDSHLLLTRAKVAALLAIWLDRTWYVSEEMWELSKWVMWVSTDTRLKAHARLRQKAAEKTAGRAAARVAESGMIQEDAERRHNAVYIRACDRLLHLLTVGGDWMGIGQLNRKMASKEKKAMRDADLDPADILADLEQAGKIETREPTGVEQGTKYRAK